MHRKFIISFTLICVRNIPILFSPWPAGGWGSFVGMLPTPPPLIPGLWLVFWFFTCSKRPTPLVNPVLTQEAFQISLCLEETVVRSAQSHFAVCAALRSTSDRPNNCSECTASFCMCPLLKKHTRSLGGDCHLLDPLFCTGIVVLISFSIVTVILLIGILYCLHVVIIVKGLFRVALLCPVVLSTVLLSP